MRGVIVPLDGSVDAEIALPHARALAGTDGRLFVLASVWNGEPVSPRRNALGSVAMRVVHDAPCPVLVTRR